MKKNTSALFITLCLLLALCVSMVACTDAPVEDVADTGLSEEEWNAAFSDETFTNFAYCEIADVVTADSTIITKTDYKFTKDNAWIKMTVADETEEMYAPDLATALSLRVQMIASIRDLVPYESYRYDAETKTYRAIEAIEIASIGASTSDITLTFSDGKLVGMKYTISFTQDGLDFNATSTVTISDYGTVVLTPPAE